MPMAGAGPNGLARRRRDEAWSGPVIEEGPETTLRPLLGWSTAKLGREGIVTRGPIGLIKGWPGKPSHPPLTDASIGAYTVGVAMLVLGAIGVEETQMAHGSLLAIGGGLVLAAPTALTGLLDWLDIPKGTPARTTATVHLLVMVGATVLFALAFVAQLDGYDAGRIETLALVLGLAAGALLAAGGYVGGTLVFHYGVRVLKRPESRVGDALVPGRAEDEPAREPQGGGEDAPRAAPPP